MGFQDVLVGSVALAALFGTGVAFAADARDDATHDGRVISLSAETLVMTAKDGVEHSHTLVKDAPLTLDGKSCRWNEIMKGMRVRVSTKDGDIKVATRVEALDKQSLFANTHDGAVVSAKAGSLVMSDKDGKNHEMTISRDAAVTCDGKVCKAGELKVGMKIRVTTRQTDESMAVRIEALDKQASFSLSL
jgi:flavoprotein